MQSEMNAEGRTENLLLLSASAELPCGAGSMKQGKGERRRLGARGGTDTSPGREHWERAPAPGAAQGKPHPSLQTAHPHVVLYTLHFDYAIAHAILLRNDT